MKDEVMLSECQICKEIFVEEMPDCKVTQNGAYSAEWKSLQHHGSPVSLLGFATDVRLGCSKQKASSGK